MSRLICRDPFAREEIHSERFYSTHGNKCGWCGSEKATPKGRKYLYQYWIEKDSQNGRRNEIRGLFCSASCMRSYHD